MAHKNLKDKKVSMTAAYIMPQFYVNTTDMNLCAVAYNFQGHIYRIEDGVLKATE